MRRIRWRRVGRGTLLGLTVMLAALVVAAGAGEMHPLVDHFNDVRPHLAVLLLVLTVVHLFARPRWHASVAAAAAVAAALPVAALHLPAAETSATSGPGDVTVVHAVVRRGFDVSAFAAEAADADVALLSRPDAGVLREATAAMPGHRLAGARHGSTGVFVRRGLAAGVSVIEPLPGVAVPQVRFCVGLQDVAVLHMPVGDATHASAAAAAVVGLQGAGGTHTLVVGDAYGSPVSARSRGFAKRTHLFDVHRSRGLRGTWPTCLPGPLRLGHHAALVGQYTPVAELRTGGGGTLRLAVRVGGQRAANDPP